MFKLISDTSCDWIKEYADEHNVTLVPLYTTFDGQTYYKEQFEISYDEFYRKISVSHGIHAVGQDTGKAQLFGKKISVGIVGGACQRTASQRKPVYALKAVSEPFPVAGEHLVVCQQMICQRDRLCPLQVCVSRHYGVHVLFGKLFKGFQQLLKKSVY